ncbi:autotransporter domain-containing protein [Chitinimonas sp. PSY-7]|uniref:autotransporter domain-containing protein n=1 Tax=Chitinimonas sp. PSY-7 TaxID=3459088 RepID=UPI0040401A1E
MKRIGLVRKTFTALAVSAALAPATVLAAGGYSNTYFFGDSLTDTGAFGNPAAGTGNVRFTTNWSNFYADLLAAKFGKTLSSVNSANPALGTTGNNYAQGGARATEVAGAPADLGAQVTNFLTNSGGKADPNALYTVWIGGNDVVPALTAASGAGGALAGQAIMAQAATDTLTQIGTLQAAGAKHILVLNAPDVSKTPRLFFNVAGIAATTVAQTVATGAGGATAYATNLLGAVNPALAGNAALVSATASALTAVTPANLNASVQTALNTNAASSTATVSNVATAATNSIVTGYPAAAAKAVADVLFGAGVLTTTAQYNATVAALTAGITAQAGAALNAQSATINTQISNGYATASAGALGLVDSVYNANLAAGLSALGADGSIIQLDVNRLMKEVLANPSAYGFDNVTGNACASNANNCFDGTTGVPMSAGYDNSQRYFFSDTFHPTPEVHRAVFQYIASVLDAPYFAAQLVNAQSAAPQSTHAAIDERGVRARSVNGMDVYVRMNRLHNDFKGNAETLESDGANTATTVGIDSQVGANAVVGAAVTQVRHSTEFSNGIGEFRATSRLMSLYGRYDLGMMSFGGDVFFGSSRFDKINRHITLGTATRTEKGDTSGTMVGFRLLGSYTMAMGSLSLIPTASLTYSESTIGGYAEQNQCGTSAAPAACSTAMRFDKQRVDSLLLGLGGKAEMNFDRITPFASLMAYKETKDDKRTVRAGLVTQPTSFNTDVGAPDSSYTVLTGGARASFTKTLSGYVSYSHTFGLGKEKRNALGLGLQGTF